MAPDSWHSITGLFQYELLDNSFGSAMSLLIDQQALIQTGYCLQQNFNFPVQLNYKQAAT
jgi:hypothetical protein